MYVKAQTEYDENKAKIQENIRKKKMDPDVILSCEKELDRLSLATEELKTTLDANLDNLNSKRALIYSKCMLQLMDRYSFPSFISLVFLSVFLCAVCEFGSKHAR